MEANDQPELSRMLPAPRTQATIPQEDIIAAMLAFIVYEARESSEVPEEDSETRLKRVLLDPYVKAIIGEGWTIEKATAKAAIFKNSTQKCVYLAVCGEEEWSKIEKTRNETVLRRCANSIDKEFSDLLHSLCDSGCTVMLTGHAVGGNVALLLSKGIYCVRTFGSIEIGADADPDQTLTRHYRLQGDTISQRSHTRNNIKTLPFDGSASDAHNMLEILSALLHPDGRVFALDKRTKNSLLDMQALQESFEQTHQLDVAYEAEPIDSPIHGEIVAFQQEKSLMTPTEVGKLAQTRTLQPESGNTARLSVLRPGASKLSNTIPPQAAPDMTLPKPQTSHSEVSAKKATELPKDQITSQVTNTYNTHHKQKVTRKKKSHHHVEELTTQTATQVSSEKQTTTDGTMDITRFDTTETKTESLKIDGGLHSNNVKETTVTTTSIKSREDGAPLETKETLTDANGSVTHEKVEVMHEMTEVKVTKDAQNQETSQSEVKTQFGNKTTNNNHKTTTYKDGKLTEKHTVTAMHANLNDEQRFLKTVTTTTETDCSGHLAKTVRTTEEVHKTFDKNHKETTVYSNKVVASSGAKEGFVGNFVNETVETKDGVSRVLDTRLNAGTDWALGKLVIASLETASVCYSKWQKGEKIEKKFLADQFVEVLSLIGEGYFAAQAGEIIAATGHLDKALPMAAWAMAIAFLVRNGYSLMTMSLDDQKKKLAGVMTYEGLASTIEVTGSIARTGLQLVLVGLKRGYSGPTMFGIDLVINTSTQLLSTLTEHGFNSEALLQCGKHVVQSSVTAGVGTLASIGTTKAITYLLGTSTTIGMSVVTCGLSALAFFSATALCAKYLQRSTSPTENAEKEKTTTTEDQDFLELLGKRNLPYNATLPEIKRTYRMLAYATHPDRGGSTEAFQEVNRDFEALTTLFLLQENKKLHGDKNPTKLSFLQRAVDTLQSVIRRFLKQEPKTENELRELLEPLEQNPDIPECNPEAQKCFKEATNIIDGFFGKLKYPDLQQYAASFASNGYDNEQHLLDIADNEVELNRVLDICGVKLQGHRDRFRLALKDLKQGRVSYAQLDTQSPFSWFMH